MTYHEIDDILNAGLRSIRAVLIESKILATTREVLFPTRLAAADTIAAI